MPGPLEPFAGPFEPLPPLRDLVRHEVRFVLIGGLAAILRGAPIITQDLDVCHDRRWDNLERLAGALVGMDARLRGAPEGLPFLLDAQTLYNGDSFTFTTTHGSVDILATPSGTGGYDDLHSNASSISVAPDVDIAVASIADLIRMKQASQRVKDRAHLEILGALRDEVEGKSERDDRHLYGEGRRPPL